jgi:hypothetical protein
MLFPLYPITCLVFLDHLSADAGYLPHWEPSNLE